MYLRISTKTKGSKAYQYLQLCQAYRNRAGAPRTRVLVNFGNLEALDRKNIDSTIDGLLAYSSNPHRPRFSDIEHMSSKDYGDILAILTLWDRLRIAQSIALHLKGKRPGFDVAGMVKLMVVNRLSDPLSKLGLMRWLNTVYLSGLEPCSVQYQHLLRAMDYLVEIKEQIERDLYNELVNLFNIDVDLVFYDLTSTFFEGEGPQIAARGYSRDKRPDRPQILLGLVLTKEGFPIYHDVFSGNTPDVATLGGVISHLKARYHIARCIFVCDRGLVSKDNLRALDEAGFPYIVAIRRRRSKESEDILQKTLHGFAQREGLGSLLLKEKERGPHRYILCHNPEVAKEKRKLREKLFAQISSEISRLNALAKKGKLSPEELYHRAKTVIEDKGMSRFFRVELEAGRAIPYIEPQEIERENFLDGKFFLKTNLSGQELSAENAVHSYKQLQEIERAFREIKDFLKIRPIFHYSERRVKAHVFICVLAYLLEKTLQCSLQRAKLQISAQKALDRLRRLKAIGCLVDGQIITTTTNVDPEMKKIFHALNIPPPPKLIDSQ